LKRILDITLRLAAETTIMSYQIHNTSVKLICAAVFVRQMYSKGGIYVYL